MLTQALVSSSEDLNRYLAALDEPDAAYLSIQAELVLRRLGDLDQVEFDMIRQEAIRRPQRWRLPLRGVLSKSGARVTDVQRAVAIMEEIGGAEDIVLLRSIGKKEVDARA